MTSPEDIAYGVAEIAYGLARSKNTVRVLITKDFANVAQQKCEMKLVVPGRENLTSLLFDVIEIKPSTPENIGTHMMDDTNPLVNRNSIDEPSQGYVVAYLQKRETPTHTTPFILKSV